MAFPADASRGLAGLRGVAAGGPLQADLPGTRATPGRMPPASLDDVWALVFFS